MMKVNVYDVKGEITGEIALPPLFETEFRPDMIKKAVTVIQHNKRQPYGTDPTAGKKHAVRSWRPGRGVSRIPRLSQGRRGAFAPGTVGGRKAHPPKSEKDFTRKINKKEMKEARNSAFAALSKKNLVQQRGHQFDEKLSLPIIIDKKVEKIQKTAEIKKLMDTLGVGVDIDRAKKGKHIRAGKGTRRGRKYKMPKSLLFIVTKKDNIEKAARNLPGVTVLTPKEINVEHLAPGGQPARLTIFTTSALEELK
jgi:large subunit ribosomal protein L4e